MIELLIALAITALLLGATLVALDASHRAYQQTTREASTHTIARLTIDRISTLIRTGIDFGPQPVDPNDSVVYSNMIEIVTPNGQGIIVEWVEDEERLYVRLFDPETGDIASSHVLLDGVVAQFDGNGDVIKPFTLEFQKGRRLYRALIDLTVVPNDDLTIEYQEGDARPEIRLVTSAMPRFAAFNPLD